MMVTAATDEQKAMLEHMAQTWDGLALERERWAAQQQRIADFENVAEKPS